MTKHRKQLGNPLSTGDAGGNFETEIGTCFVTLMLSGGFAPSFLAPFAIKEIRFQKGGLGYSTDDLIVLVERPGSKKVAKLLCQIKRSINIGRNKDFKEVVFSAWTDFNNIDLFTRGQDSIALITGALSKNDISNARTILEWARHRKSPQEFLTEVNLAKYSSNAKKTKLNVFREQGVRI